MRESYLIILNKLKYDRKRIDEQIGNLVDDEFSSEYEKSAYSKLLGKRQYCDDLIDFFTELIESIRS